LDFAPAKVGGSETSKLKRELVPTLDENKTMQNSNVVVTAPSAVVNPQENLHIRVAFPIDKECIRKFALKDNGKDIVIYHLYPLLSDWQGKTLPDEVNPRSHDEQALKSGVAHKIETTIIESPEDFYLANRGATILAQDLKYDPEKGVVELFVTDEMLHGIADGATTDAVLGKVQRDIKAGEAKKESGESLGLDSLRRGRIHLEVILGLVSKERIDAMVEGRNTSRQVTPWSMSDFKGSFDWISDILEASSSPFRGKIGYEENAGKQITVHVVSFFV
jgi:AIPR protein